MDSPGGPRAGHAITRVESGGQGRRAAQLAAMNVVDRVRFKMIEAGEHGTSKHKTQKQLERSIVVGKKAHDDELLLESYFALAQYWEEHESAEEVQLNLRCALDVIERLRGGKSRLVPDDPVPLVRIMEQRGRLHDVQALYMGIVEAIQAEFGLKEKRALPFVERLLDVCLRMRSLDIGNIQQQTVQRLREANIPPTMQWYYPPQGEMRVVPHIGHMNTQIERGLYALAKKEVQRALKEFAVVTDWRTTIRQYRKDWRRKDASLEEQVLSLEIMAEAVFRIGECYSLMNRTTSAERRMLEGIEHWEELIALEVRNLCCRLPLARVSTPAMTLGCACTGRTRITFMPRWLTYRVWRCTRGNWRQHTRSTRSTSSAKAATSRPSHI